MIKEGMGKDEVHRILGAPPGRYGNPDVPAWYMEVDNPDSMSIFFNRKWYTHAEIWTDDDCMVLVGYDEHDRALGRYMFNSRSPRHTILGSLARWARRGTR